MKDKDAAANGSTVQDTALRAAATELKRLRDLLNAKRSERREAVAHEDELMRLNLTGGNVQSTDLDDAVLWASRVVKEVKALESLVIEAETDLRAAGSAKQAVLAEPLQRKADATDAEKLAIQNALREAVFDVLKFGQQLGWGVNWNLSAAGWVVGGGTFCDKAIDILQGERAMLHRLPGQDVLYTQKLKDVWEADALASRIRSDHNAVITAKSPAVALALINDVLAEIGTDPLAAEPPAESDSE